MRFKLDENLGRREAALFRNAGHDVAAVFDQNLAGSIDESVIQICREERRALVTLDMDFGNPLVFRPHEYAGIAVLRLRGRNLSSELQQCINTLINGLKENDLNKKLWIIEIGRIRIYRAEDHSD